jgi:hypothetical protein
MPDWVYLFHAPSIKKKRQRQDQQEPTRSATTTNCLQAQLCVTPLHELESPPRKMEPYPRVQPRILRPPHLSESALKSPTSQCPDTPSHLEAFKSTSLAATTNLARLLPLLASGVGLVTTTIDTARSTPMQQVFISGIAATAVEVRHHRAAVQGL